MDKIVKQGDKFVEVQLGVLVFQEADSYLAYCPALNLSTYGDSISDAKIAFEDVFDAYLQDCTRMGTLEKDLRAHGWEMHMSVGKYEVTQPKEVDLNIPAGMLKKQFNEPFRIPIPAA